MTLSLDVGSAQKGESDGRDTSSVPLGSKESHDPHATRMSMWLRAKSLT